MRKEWPVLLGAVVLIGLQTTHLLDWLLLQSATLVLGGLGGTQPFDFAVGEAHCQPSRSSRRKAR